MTGEVWWGLAALPWTGEANAARPGEYALHSTIDSRFCAQGCAKVSKSWIKCRPRNQDLAIQSVAIAAKADFLLGIYVAALGHRSESSALAQSMQVRSTDRFDLTKLKKTASLAFE